MSSVAARIFCRSRKTPERLGSKPRNIFSAIERFGADVAASVTGIAGPDGGTEEKPVGTVWFGIADRGGHEVAKRRAFLGDRGHVRRSASVHALELVRRHVVGWDGDR